MDAHGYTVDLDQAWRVTGEKAQQICRDRPYQDIPRLVSAVDAISHRHADVQALGDFKRCSTCGLQGRPDHPLCESCDMVQDLNDD